MGGALGSAGAGGAVGLIGVLLLWQIASLLIVENLFVSSPALVWHAAQQQVASGQLAADTLVSLSEIAVGFGLAVLVAVPLGLAMGRYRLVGICLRPVHLVLLLRAGHRFLSDP